MSDLQEEPTYGDRMYAEVVRLTAALERAQRNYESANNSLVSARTKASSVAEAMREVIIEAGYRNDYDIDRDTLIEWISDLGGETTVEVTKTYTLEVTFNIELGAESEPDTSDITVDYRGDNADLTDYSLSERY